MSPLATPSLKNMNLLDTKLKTLPYQVAGLELKTFAISSCRTRIENIVAGLELKA
jgi:hypothetical protein